VDECPKSAITPESIALMEAYSGWKGGGWRVWEDLDARRADAFEVLEGEWRAELANGK
jgi:hypothetical protein